jgi:hypothetical protein
MPARLSRNSFRSRGFGPVVIRHVPDIEMATARRQARPGQRLRVIDAHTVAVVNAQDTSRRGRHD